MFPNLNLRSLGYLERLGTGPGARESTQDHGEREDGMQKVTKCSTGRQRGVAWEVYPNSSSRHPLECVFVAATAPSLNVLLPI